MRFRVLAAVFLFGVTTVTEAAYLYDGFEKTGQIDEAGSIGESSSPTWWVSSGGRFLEQSGLGSTLMGSLPADDPTRLAYADANPTDTDGGYRPQNIFRFVNRGTWTKIRQTVYFRIRAIDASTSPNRNASNGVFLFNRYQDSQTLYYVGLRVDGYAIVKKKLHGTYSELGRVRVYGSGSYDRNTRYNYLPTDQWLGLKSRVRTNDDGTVSIRVFLDRGDGAGLERVLDVTDASSPILAGGHTGIRTDFMDVEFDGFEVRGQ
jgi:hypothetical protein